MEYADVTRYLLKSGDSEIYWNLPFIRFKEGWFNYEVNGEILTIVQAYGPHKELAKRARKLARDRKLDRIVFATKRNGKAFAKLINGKVIGTIVEVPYGRSS